MYEGHMYVLWMFTLWLELTTFDIILYGIVYQHGQLINTGCLLLYNNPQYSVTGIDILH